MEPTSRMVDRRSLDELASTSVELNTVCAFVERVSFKGSEDVMVIEGGSRVEVGSGGPL